jgi:uncharacterized protein
MKPMTTGPVILATLLPFCLAMGLSAGESIRGDAMPEGFVSLFDGETLEGWIGAVDSYVVEDGLLKSLPDKSGNLETEQQFGDFIFYCEFRMTPGANNGIGLRLPHGKHAATQGFEVQILDNTAPRYANLKPYQFHGSVYGIVPAKRGYLRPLGEWNRQEIRLIDRQITVILNGEVIVDADLDEASTPETLDGKDHPGLKRKTGHVGLLGHKSEVHFRNIWIKDLTEQAETAAEEQEPSRMLFVTQSEGFTHGSVKRRDEEGLAPAEVAIVQLGEQTGLFRADCTQDVAADFTKENLKNYDIVAFYTTGNLPIAQEDRDYFFNDWLKQEGHGVLGFHSATDTYHNYEPYWDMIGGTFIRHPWNAGHTVTLTNHEPDNPVVAPFGKEFVIKDEIYMYRNWQPEKVRVLLSLDYSKSPTNNPVPLQFGYHVPVCWIKNYGDGKVYVNNLGHNETSWTNEAYLDSITQAVRWIRGEIEVDATPNPEVSAAQEEKSKRDFAEGEFKVQGER